MDHNVFLPSLLSYSLGYPIIDNDGRCKIFHEFMNKIKVTSQIFGVFVGVTRSKKDTLTEWPEDIHGSIGHYKKTFSPLTEDELCEQIFNVAYSAMWKDDRRKYFKHILSDPDSVLDVKFMLLPLKEVDYKGKFISSSAEAHASLRCAGQRRRSLAGANSTQSFFSNKDMGII